MKHLKIVMILIVAALVGFSFFVPLIRTSYPPNAHCMSYGCPPLFEAYGSLSYQYLGIGGVTVTGITQYAFVT
jgi:hypothetical protein